MILQVEQIRGFEAELYKYVDTANPDLLRAIMDKKALDDDMKAAMTKVIKEAKETFVQEREAVAGQVAWRIFSTFGGGFAA